MSGESGKAGAVAANRHVFDLATRLRASPGRLSWDFTGERGRTGCAETVSLTVSEYETLRGLGADVLAAGHARSPVLKARELVEQARALQAQAEQQARRAARNLRGGEPKFGQTVWIHGRQALFLYLLGDAGAAIRYLGEPEARIVPQRKISLQPPRKP